MAPQTHLLDGITVLNLGAVGPAARAGRMLADYGARVVMIAPVSKKGALQTKPVYHTYGAGRGFEKMRLDLKSAAGVEALLKLADNSMGLLGRVVLLMNLRLICQRLSLLGAFLVGAVLDNLLSLVRLWFMI